MKKVLLLLLGVTITFASCEKDEVVVPEEVVVQDFDITGVFGASLVGSSIIDESGAIFDLQTYLVDFGYGVTDGSVIDGYVEFADLLGCVFYDGTFTVSDVDHDSMVLTGGEGSVITLTYVNTTTIGVSGTIAYQAVTGSLIGYNGLIPLCYAGKKVYPTLNLTK